MSCQHCGRQHPAGTVDCPVTGEAMNAAGLIGTSVDRYQLVSVLGVGGFGSVYLANHVHTGAPVALKLLKRALSSDRAMLDRFLREARAVQAVNSEHIVRVLDAGKTPDGLAFLALEYLDGLDLKELAAKEGPLGVERLIAIALQVLDGLGAAHAKGIVHRDMKPANVFVLRRSDGRDLVKLLDFGISKVGADFGTGGGLTMTGTSMGTPGYMAPEQFFDARNVDLRADLYSVAAMLFELFARRLPHAADSLPDLIVKVRMEVPPPLRQVAPHVSPAVAQVIDRGLAKQPDQRFASAQDMARALAGALRGGPAVAADQAATDLWPAPAPRASPVRPTQSPMDLSALVAAKPSAAAPSGLPPAQDITSGFVGTGKALGADGRLTGKTMLPAAAAPPPAPAPPPTGTPRGLADTSHIELVRKPTRRSERTLEPVPEPQEPGFFDSQLWVVLKRALLVILALIVLQALYRHFFPNQSVTSLVPGLGEAPPEAPPPPRR